MKQAESQEGGWSLPDDVSAESRYFNSDNSLPGVGNDILSPPCDSDDILAQTEDEIAQHDENVDYEQISTCIQRGANAIEKYLVLVSFYF